VIIISEEKDMILVRDIFQLKFGKAREARKLFQEGMEHMKNMSISPLRFLTDLTGPYYTLVMESTFENLTEFEKYFKNETEDPEWKNWYQKFIPLVESGRREIFNIEELK